MSAMEIDKWENFFKPEARSSGAPIYRSDKVNLSQPSDTEIKAFIKGSTAVRVSLKTSSVSSPVIIADCTCPTGRKERLCKHVWATLLKVAEDKSDFLDGKSKIEVCESTGKSLADSAVKRSVTKSSFQSKPLSPEQLERQQSYKNKQNEYRKEQYQKQKQRLKEKKSPGKVSKFATPALPEDVKVAIAYFIENGFPMENPINAEVVKAAKKKLSRVFHPDIGGSHQEILELNKNAEVLLEYVGDKS